MKHSVLFVGAFCLATAATSMGATLTCSMGSFVTTEGSAFAGGGTCTDSDGTVTVADLNGTIAWGDGTTLSATITAAGANTFTIFGAHTYAEEGTYTITATVNDTKNALTSTATATATVTDAPLTANPVAVSAISGSPFTGLTATFTDANSLAPVSDFTATISWGDGTPTSTGTVTSGVGSFQVTGTHTYAAPGTYSVTTTIHDIGGSSATAVATATVTAALTVTSAAVTATEGAPFNGTVATLIDSDPTVTVANLTATIGWGDGTTTTGTVTNTSPNHFAVSGTHTYADEGTYTVTTTVTDTKNTVTRTATGTASVSDAPLAATPVAVAATAGIAFTGPTATFTDGNPLATASDFTATIAWGDGTTTAGTVSASGGGFQVTGTHTWALPGAYTVTTTIHDIGGASATAAGTATVSPGPATHFSVTAPASAISGTAFAFTVTALDQFNNTATGYAGTVAFTSSDGAATLPPNSTLTSGIGTFSATLRTAGNRTITATDTLNPAITGTSNTIVVTVTADLSIVKTASTSLPFGGQNVTYTVVVANGGPSTATGVTVTDVLPAGSTFVSASPGGVCSGTSTITCNIATLASGATSTITLVVAAPAAGGTVTNTATVTAAQSDPTPANNSSTASVTLAPSSSIPALSEALLVLLAAMLAAIAVMKLR